MIDVVELFTVQSAPTGLLLILCWGVLPSALLRTASLCYRRDDRRRITLVHELYSKPLLLQPFWAVQQAERAIVEGLVPRVVARRKAARRRGIRD